MTLKERKEKMESIIRLMEEVAKKQKEIITMKRRKAKMKQTNKKKGN